MCASKVTRGIVSVVDLTATLSKTLVKDLRNPTREELQVPAPGALVFRTARIRTTAVFCSLLPWVLVAVREYNV